MNPVRTVLDMMRGKGLSSQLLRVGAGSLGLRAANAVLQLATTAILARSLTVSEFGVYAYVLATISLLAIPAHAGIPTQIVRLTAAYSANGQWSLLLGLWERSRNFLLSTSMLVVLATTVYFYLSSSQIEIESGMLRATLAAALLIVPFKSLAESRSAALRGLGRVVPGQMAEQLVRPLLLTLLLGAWLLLPGWHMSAPAAMGLHALATLGAMVFATVLLARSRPAECRGVQPVYVTGEWFRTVIPLSLLAGGQVILQQSGSFLLGAMGSVESVAPYRVAIQGAAIVGFGLLTATSVLNPHVARLHALGDTRNMQAIVTSSARAVFISALALTLFFVFFGRKFIMLAFGARYLPAYLPMVILCIGTLIRATAGPASAVLTMTGHERYTVVGVATATVANVVLGVLLIPIYDTIGAAIATLFAFAIWTVQLTRFAYRRTGIHTGIIGLLKSRAATDSSA